MYELLRGILVDELDLDARAFSPDARREDAGLDSLAMVELSMLLQQRHNLQVSDLELFKTERVSDIVLLMQERAGA